ncbi:hypothetical protein [Treponema primitia]|uniref:hypothetical protein n=1 Tax=Treponema primitia TaxID=88058 RepID=UPI0012FD8007|nr:hypothetical protein [Treponema primitia]
MALVIIGTVVFFVTRPRPVWLVDESYRTQWGKILDTSAPPRRLSMAALPEDGIPPKNRYGYIITTKGPPGAEPAPIVIYPGLASAGEYSGALVLALDPWMMFRDFKDPTVSRSRVDSPIGGEGVLIVPGRDRNVVWAWTAQLLQQQPGIFPLEEAPWEEAVETLFRDRRFQPGAETYGWMDAMPLLYRSSPAWLYAPLSRIRQEPLQETSNLEANRFPEREDWHEFGLQADILWAIPFGNEKKRAKLDKIIAWLGDPKTQTQIADTLNWIPAHREGGSYNAISRTARLAWLSSSFVWQIRSR